MIINFEEDYLEELYENGKSTSKKYRIQPQIVAKYKKAIDYLKAADRIEDLFPIKSLNYEKLSGDKDGIESVRAGDKYRIEFISKLSTSNERILTICSILELSNHYS